MIFGQNRKRKRGEIDIEQIDDASKRKLKRLEERMMQVEAEDEEDSEVDLRQRMKE